ncbi:MAG TPA: hypothetical protein VM389_00535, partial [Phycisphaerae bacterium]|nr:hypothetical protein [Phycisphaerae bacterium]
MTLAEQGLLLPRATGGLPLGSDPGPGLVVPGHNELAGKQGVGPDFYHLSAGEYGVLRDNQPFGAGGVLYADAAGKLKT